MVVDCNNVETRQMHLVRLGEHGLFSEKRWPVGQWRWTHPVHVFKKHRLGSVGLLGLTKRAAIFLTTTE